MQSSSAILDRAGLQNDDISEDVGNHGRWVALGCFLYGTFLELLHRPPTTAELATFTELANGLDCAPGVMGGRTATLRTYINLPSRKYLRDVMLWGGDYGAWRDNYVLRRVHRCVLWRTVNRMVDQLLAGYVQPSGTNPLDHAARIGLMECLYSRILEIRGERANSECEFELLAAKESFGRYLRAAATDYLRRDPFNWFSTNELVVMTNVFDWYPKESGEGPRYKRATTRDECSLHPVEMCGGWDGIAAVNRLWVCRQIDKMRQAGIDMLSKTFRASPCESGKLEAASRGMPLAHSDPGCWNSDLIHMVLLRDLWLHLRKQPRRAARGPLPLLFCGGDLDHFHCSYLRLAHPRFGGLDNRPTGPDNWIDFREAEVNYCFYAGFRAFAELIPACMLGLLRGESSENGAQDKLPISLWFGAMGPQSGARAFYMPFGTPVAEDLDRRFAADFFGIKAHMIVTEDWCYNNAGGEVEPPPGGSTRQPVFESGDYYRWVPYTAPKEEMEGKVGVVQRLYSIAPGYDDTMNYRLTPWVMRHEYGNHLMHEWLWASQYVVGEAPQLSRIWLQCWDEMIEGICITETLEHGKFYINAIPRLKALTRWRYGKNVPGPGDPGWEAFVRTVVCTAYWAVLGYKQASPAMKTFLNELIVELKNGTIRVDEIAERIFKPMCYHAQNLWRWPPVIDLNLLGSVNNEISDEADSPNFYLKVSYQNFGIPKTLSTRFMIYLPVRIRYDPDYPRNDVVKRAAAYVKPLCWEDRHVEFPGENGEVEAFDRVLRVALCPNRLEFKYRYLKTGTDFSDNVKQKFCVFIGKNDILAFIRRTFRTMRVDTYPPIGGDGDEVRGETGDEEHPWGSAGARVFATLTAHYAEGSPRFEPTDCLRLRIPIADSEGAWFGEGD